MYVCSICAHLPHRKGDLFMYHIDLEARHLHHRHRRMLSFRFLNASSKPSYRFVNMAAWCFGKVWYIASFLFPQTNNMFFRSLCSSPLVVLAWSKNSSVLAIFSASKSSIAPLRNPFRRRSRRTKRAGFANCTARKDTRWRLR